MRVTAEEREWLDAHRPPNWDEMGSAGKDLWEEALLSTYRLHLKGVTK